MATKKWLGGTSSSANDAAIASNYSPSGVPVTGDDLYVEANPGGTDYSITANLTTFTAIALASINVSQTYTGQIGLTTNGTNSAYLQVGGTNSSAIAVNIGYQFGGTSPAAGSSLIRLDLGSMQATINITNSGQTSALSGAGPITLLGTHTSNILSIVGGTASSAVDPLETSRFTTINNGGNLFLGTGCTLTTAKFNQFGGTSLIRSAVGTITLNGGGITTAGAGAITLLNAQSGSIACNSTGTITTLNVWTATADFSGDPQNKTVTTINLYSGANLNLNNGVKNSITITNPITTSAIPGSYTVIPWANSSIAFT